MKGNETIIEHLNLRLTEELTAINQYMVHAEMCDNWWYEKLHKEIEKRAIDEMKHTEKLIARILFLEGRPVVSNLNKMHIGDEVPKMYTNDHMAEIDAIRGYNESIRVAGELGDHGSRELLEALLKEEEAHVDLIESHLDQIKQMGVENYLAAQMDWSEELWKRIKKIVFGKGTDISHGTDFGVNVVSWVLGHSMEDEAKKQEAY